MLQIIYLPNSKIKIDNFIVINNYDDLLDVIKYEKISFLSLPVCESSLDILDTIIENNINIKTIHIQQNNNLLIRLKIFFEFAKKYSENDISNNVILKHNYIDKILEKK